MDQTEKYDRIGYSFIRNQVIHHGTFPSLREICRAVGYNSPRSAQLLLQRLEGKHLIRTVKGSFVLTPRQEHNASERTIGIPLIGTVPCGTPTLAEQTAEAVIEVSTRIATPGHVYFILRAQGDSMNKAGIQDGDLVLVRQQPVAEPGDKVVALINDDATIKEYHPQENAVVLMPRSTNTKHRPIILTEDFQVQGVVVTTIPNIK